MRTLNLHYKPIRTKLQREARAFDVVLTNVRNKHPLWGDLRCRNIAAGILKKRSY